MKSPTISPQPAGYFRIDELANTPEVTAEAAARNKAEGRGGPHLPRPAKRGLLNVSRATFNRLVRDGKFVAPVKLSDRAVGFPKEAVNALLAARNSSAGRK